MKDFAIQVNDNNDRGDILDLKISPTRDAQGKIISGLVLGNTLEQNKAFLLIARPGDFKLMPRLGVGFEDLLLSDNLLEMRHKIREQFKIDGLVIDNLELYNTQRINIKAHYE